MISSGSYKPAMTPMRHFLSVSQASNIYFYPMIKKAGVVASTYMSRIMKQLSASQTSNIYDYQIMELNFWSFHFGLINLLLANEIEDSLS